MDKTIHEAARDLLPLKPVHLAVLLSLSNGPRHGFSIMEDVNHQLDGVAIVGAGTLYRILKEMREEKLIVREAAPEGSVDDARRQYNGLTALGRAVLAAEARRLRDALASRGHLDVHPEAGR